MRLWTYDEIKNKVQKDLNQQAEVFIDDDELLAYVNEGIDEAEAEIHSLYEDYFLAESFLPLVAGQSEISLPTDIYANKIRGIYYYDGTDKYEIKRIRLLKDSIDVDDNADYTYLLLNNSTGGRKIKLFPASRETSASNVIVYYLRNAAELEDDTDECDIPEFANFVIQYAKVKCLEKEPENPLMPKAVMDLEKQRALMIKTLKNMIDDNSNTIINDDTFYNEMN